MRRPSALAAAALLALTAGAGGCAADAGGSSGAALEVVAAFYPLEYLATEVGGEQVAVTGLAPPGVDAHDLELTPSQIAEISRADLVIHLAGFQPAVDAAVAEHAADSFDVTTAVPLLENSGADEHAGDEEHAAEEHPEEGGDDHGHGPTDPHLWLDPQRMTTLAGELAGRLAALDPDHAADYTAGAEALVAELEALDTAYADGLADCQRRELVVSHAAFGYLADRYDLRQIAVTGLSPEDEPSPQELQEAVEQARAVGATTVFFEVLVSPELADQVAREVGAGTAVLDPIEGLAPDSQEDYVSLMRQNLEALRSALGCA